MACLALPYCAAGGGKLWTASAHNPATAQPCCAICAVPGCACHGVQRPLASRYTTHCTLLSLLCLLCPLWRADGKDKLHATFLLAEDPSQAPPGTTPRGVSILARDLEASAP